MKKIVIILGVLIMGASLQAKVQEPEYIYKIVKLSDWKESKVSYKGNDWDQRDGFIHMSTASQVERIAKKYYEHEEGLVLLKVLYVDIKDKVKWEPNSKGDLYPHVYGALSESHVVEVLKLDPHNFDYGGLQG